MHESSPSLNVLISSGRDEGVLLGMVAEEELGNPSNENENGKRLQVRWSCQQMNAMASPQKS
jgi:hypothetical protein